jgi:S-disulfanyl-L-cysteine oxidoreductase SoxD
MSTVSRFLERDDFSSNRHHALTYYWRMMFFRPGFARRSVKRNDSARQRLRAGGKPVSTFRHHALVVLTLGLICDAAAESPNLGRVATPEELAAWDISIGPDGAGLPPGSGTPRQGEAVFMAKCVACHGEKGAGKPNDQLVGGRGTLGDQAPVKTVGSFWPYATTIFDYVRRAMPLNESKSLSNDEVYAVVAYLLHLNGIIDENETVDARTLPKVRMPNADGFVTFARGK